MTGKASEEFANELTTLVCLNLPTSMVNSRDKEQAAAMLTQLAQKLGFVVAGICHGDEQQMSDILEGMTQFVYESAAQYNKTFGTMEQFRWKGPGRFPGDTGGEAGPR
jgi:hypothetical protein